MSDIVDPPAFVSNDRGPVVVGAGVGVSLCVCHAGDVSLVGSSTS